MTTSAVEAWATAGFIGQVRAAVLVLPRVDGGPRSAALRLAAAPDPLATIHERSASRARGRAADPGRG